MSATYRGIRRNHIKCLIKGSISALIKAALLIQIGLFLNCDFFAFNYSGIRVRSNYRRQTIFQPKVHTLGKSLQTSNCPKLLQRALNKLLNLMSDLLLPVLCQIYNSDETLRGHDDPSIEVFLSPSTLTPYLNWTTRCQQADPPTHKKDDIEGKLKETFENSKLGHFRLIMLY